MDATKLAEVRRRYTQAMDDLAEEARRAEAEIGTEALILLRLHPETKPHLHIFGSQFGSKTWLYNVRMDARTRRAAIEIAFGPNDPFGPVASERATPHAMLTFLEDAPALLGSIRSRVGEIRDNIAA